MTEPQPVYTAGPPPKRIEYICPACGHLHGYLVDHEVYIPRLGYRRRECLEVNGDIFREVSGALCQCGAEWDFHPVPHFLRRGVTLLT